MFAIIHISFPFHRRIMLTVCCVCTRQTHSTRIYNRFLIASARRMASALKFLYRWKKKEEKIQPVACDNARNRAYMHRDDETPPPPATTDDNRRKAITKQNRRERHRVRVCRCSRSSCEPARGNGLARRATTYKEDHRETDNVSEWESGSESRTHRQHSYHDHRCIAFDYKQRNRFEYTEHRERQPCDSHSHSQQL